MQNKKPVFPRESAHLLSVAERSSHFGTKTWITRELEELKDSTGISYNVPHQPVCANLSP